MEIIWDQLSEFEKIKMVAEKVMKWEVVGDEVEGFQFITGVDQQNFNQYLEFKEWNPVQNVSHAWEIVSKFQLWYSFNKNYDRDVKFSMGNDLSEGEFVTFVFMVRDGIKNHTYGGEAKTLQEAICIASLEAVGISTKY